MKRELSFNDLKKDQKSIRILEVYEKPSSGDNFSVNKVSVRFDNVNSKYSHDNSIKYDLSKKISIERDDNYSVVFKEK